MAADTHKLLTCISYGWDQGEDGWHTLNDASLLGIGIHLYASVIARQDAPGTETEGNLYLVGSSGSGDWAGEDHKLAYWDGTQWLFYTAWEGFQVYDKTTNQVLTANASGEFFPTRVIRPMVSMIDTDTNVETFGSLDFSVADKFHVTLTDNWSPTFANFPASGAYADMTVIIKQAVVGSKTVTWSGVTWVGGSGPTMTATANKTDIYRFYTTDGGTTIFGEVVGQNF